MTHLDPEKRMTANDGLSHPFVAETATAGSKTSEESKGKGGSKGKSKK